MENARNCFLCPFTNIGVQVRGGEVPLLKIECTFSGEKDQFDIPSDWNEYKIINNQAFSFSDCKLNEMDRAKAHDIVLNRDLENIEKWRFAVKDEDVPMAHYSDFVDFMEDTYRNHGWGAPRPSLRYEEYRRMSANKGVVQDLYTNYYACHDRLMHVLEKFGKLIVALDYDDTINDFRHDGNYYDGMISVLKQLHDHIRIVVWTNSPESRFPEIEERMKNIGLDFEGINADLVPGMVGRKIYANLYVDDHGGLPSEYRMLCNLCDDIDRYFL